MDCGVLASWVRASSRLSASYSRGYLRMCTQIVPKRQVLPLLLSSGLAQMNMMRAGPLDRLLKEGVHEIEIAERDVTIPECSHRIHVATVRRQGSNRDLNVDHRLCGKPGYGC